MGDRGSVAWRRTLLREIGWGLAGLASILLAWTLLSTIVDLIPGVSESLSALAGIIDDDFWTQAYRTGYRAVLGLTIALILGSGIGIVTGLNRRAAIAVEPLMALLLGVPATVVAIVLLIVLGPSQNAAVVAVGIFTLPPVVFNMASGTRVLDTLLSDMARSFRAPRSLVLRETVLPQLAPYFLASVRFGMGLGWKVVVLIEFLALSDGMGAKLRLAFSQVAVTRVVAWTLGFVILVSIVEYVVIQSLERYMTRWRTTVEL